MSDRSWRDIDTYTHFTVRRIISRHAHASETLHINRYHNKNNLYFYQIGQFTLLLRNNRLTPLKILTLD